MITFKAVPNDAPIPWDFFVKNYTNAIALDGYVIGPAKFDRQHKVANFNHHEGCDRLSTRATCAQVLLAVRQGLMDNFKKEDVTIWVNDCDQDVCLSVFILMNAWLCGPVINPNLNKLVHVADMMDTCGGCYPFPVDMPFMQSMAWIFEPYTIFRTSGRLMDKNKGTYESIITDVCNRIQAYLAGSGGKVELQTEFEVIGGGHGWSMVVETGQHARMALMSSGIKAFVAVRQGKDNWAYSIGRISEYIDFDIENIMAKLNIAEGLTNYGDKWGGSALIGGSPRVKGSRLNPQEVINIINETGDAEFGEHMEALRNSNAPMASLDDLRRHANQ